MKCESCGGAGGVFREHRFWNVCKDCNGTGKIIKECPCDDQSKDECGICSDNDFQKIIQDQREEITKLRYDNDLMKGKLHIIKTVMGADNAHNE